MKLNKSIALTLICILFCFNIISCSNNLNYSKGNSLSIETTVSNKNINDYFKLSLNNLIYDSNCLISNIRKKGDSKKDYLNYLNIYKEQILNIKLNFTNNTKDINTAKSKELISFATNVFDSLEKAVSYMLTGIENNSPKTIAKGFLSFLSALHNLKCYYVTHYESKK